MQQKITHRGLTTYTFHNLTVTMQVDQSECHNMMCALKNCAAQKAAKSVQWQAQQKETILAHRMIDAFCRL